MNDAFSFERSGWELFLDSLKPGTSVSAIRLLSLLEAENEETVDEVMMVLTQRRIALDISMLPKDFGSGELENRLRFESKLPPDASMIHFLEQGDPLRIYLEELSGIPAQGDPLLLSQRAANGDEDAKQMLLNLFLYRAVELAADYTGHGVLLLDLIQEASLGLWEAVLQYKQGDISQQVDWGIRQSIGRIILLQARENGVLQSMQKNMEAYQKADNQLLVSLGRNATMEEIAVELGITAEQADVIRDMLLNAAAMEKAKMPVKEQQPEDSLAVEDTAYFQSRQRVNEMLSCLSEVEARILTLRFGLEEGISLTVEAVSEKLGISSDDVVAAEAAALNKLRNG